MTNQVNIISICCNIFLNVNDHSKKTDSAQPIFRNHINDLISIAFNYIGKTDRIMLNTGNGAAIVYMGSPEDAMFMAMDMRKEILSANIEGSAPLSVCIGIHLEPISSLNDIQGKANIIGNGIDIAKRIMNHAKPNEILVSRTYYENTPPSTQQISTMFNGSGLKHENHVLEYQAYLVNLNKKQTHNIKMRPTLEQPLILTESMRASKSTKFLNTIKWKYAAGSLFGLFALFTTVKLTFTPAEPVIHNKTVQNLPEKKFRSESFNTFKSDITLQDNSNNKNEALLQEEKSYKTLKQSKDKTNLAKKDSKIPKHRASSMPEKNKTKEIISWKILRDSIRQGQKNKCTQLEITLKQCH